MEENGARHLIKVQDASPVEPTLAATMGAAFAGDRANAVARNAVTSMDVLAAARNPTAMRTYSDTYGVSLPRTGEVTHQNHTGRCWMFATMNVARAKTMALLDVDTFEFSQAFGMFYDKLEKGNIFLANVVATAGLPASDRTVTYLMENPCPDGGEFRFAANLIAKWGLVPKSAMPESACTQDSSQMNAQLNRLLRHDAAILREVVAMGRGADEVEGLRREMLDGVHRMLCVCLGEPPTSFDFEVEVGKNAKVDESVLSEQLPAASEDDTDPEKGPRRVLRERSITPREFCERYVGFDPADYVELVSVPGDDRPYEHLYGIRLMDTVVGGERWRFLNMPSPVLEDAAIASLSAGVPCYMGCDVSQQLGRHLTDFPGVLGLGTMDFERLFGVDLTMSRSSMFDLHETSFTHAMTFQGVELGQDMRPAAWRVENSWGKESCKDGYLVMSGEWYRVYGGCLVVERRFLPERILQLWDTLPIDEVEPWSGMASAVGLAE